MNLVGEVERACINFFFKGYVISPISPKYRSIFDKKTLAEAVLIIGVEGDNLTLILRVVKIRILEERRRVSVRPIHSW